MESSSRFSRWSSVRVHPTFGSSQTVLIPLFIFTLFTIQLALWQEGLHSNKSKQSRNSFQDKKTVAKCNGNSLQTKQSSHEYHERALRLADFYESVCCPISLSHVSSRERRCSIRGRHRRTSIRGVLAESAVQQTSGQYSFAEFGVEKAESAFDFQAALKVREDVPVIWLYDTFAGLPKASSHDSPQAHGRKDKFVGDELNAIKTWRNFGFANIVTRKGLFAEQLQSRVTPTKLAILHCDGDLYESIFEPLFRLYAASVMNRGVVIIDDWFGGHTGTWETARKAVYDFIISAEIAPKLQTPLGLSAFWFKNSDSEKCRGCYSESKPKKWRMNLRQEDMIQFKSAIQSLINLMDVIVKPECLQAKYSSATSRHNSALRNPTSWYMKPLLEIYTKGSNRTIHVCNDRIESRDLGAIAPRAIYLGKDCTNYDSLLDYWWPRLETYGIFVLECWSESTHSPRYGCRPDFYRFVYRNGIFPLLTTLWMGDEAFWVKGPLPIG